MSVKPSTKVCTPSSTPSRVKVAVTMLNRTITPRTTDASPPTSRPQRCSGTANDMAMRVTPLARNSAPAARVRVSAAARVLRRINTPSTASSAPPSAVDQKCPARSRNRALSSSATPTISAAQPRNRTDTTVTSAVSPRMITPATTSRIPSRMSTPVLRRQVCVDLEAALRDRSGLVIVHGDRGTHRARLTREHEPGLGLPRLQRVVHGHLDRALADLGAAGGTHPALAGERQVEATGQGGVEHGVCWTDLQLGLDAVQHHGEMTGVAGDNWPDDGGADMRRTEQLEVDMGRRYAEVEQRLPDLHRHWLRAAEEGFVDAIQLDHRRGQLPHLLGSDPAVEQIDVLTLPAEQVQHLQAL